MRLREVRLREVSGEATRGERRRGEAKRSEEGADVLINLPVIDVFIRQQALVLFLVVLLLLQVLNG